MRHSDCPSKDEGGELGWLERGQTTPEFDRQVFRLREGLAAFPVESRWGYHVVSVDAIESGEELGVRSSPPAHFRLSRTAGAATRTAAVPASLQERYGVRADAIEAEAA